MTETSMLALVKTAPEPGMTIEERPVPEPGPGEVRLAVESVGIDGGVEALVYDWHESAHHYADDLPRVFGHEFAGTVDAVGPDVEPVAVGDRVAVEPGITCGRCRNCRDGRMDVCANREVVGIDGRPGALAEFVVVPAANCYPIPADVGADAAAFLEVLALGVNAIEYSAFAPGDRVAITGPGPVGLGVLVACSVGGAGAVAMIGADVDREHRLPVAAAMGADETRTIDRGPLAEPVDVFVEASGHVSALEAAIESTRMGGQVVQIGLFHGEAGPIPVDVDALVQGGIDFRAVRSRRNSSWRRAIALAGRTDLSPVIGPSFDLTDHEAAFAAKREQAGVKIVLNP